MSGLEVNTKKLGEIYKEWRGNESCYDNGRPVFDADELLDFAQFCLKHEANGVSYEPQAATCNIPHVSERTWIVDEIIENLRPFESANSAAQWFNMYGR